MKTASVLSVSAWVRLAFAVTIFLSAFLLFLVQPLISKIILPWFGGSTGVWATCMVFFQAMLCLGYAYAHLMQRLPLSTQRWCHWSLLGLGLVCLPVMPGESWKPVDGNHPSIRILTILLLKTGLPYLALSATGPLLQAWHARLFPQSQTYRLYALSNVASLASLLLFPLWFERTFPSAVLSNIWSGLFVAFAASCGYVAFTVARSLRVDKPTTAAKPSGLTMPLDDNRTPTFGNYLLWLLLPAFASFLLVGGTSHLCQDIASTPFLWILPLCLYLLSFILCFDAPGWYVRRVYVVLGLIGVYGIIAMRELGDSDTLLQGWLANGSLPILGPILEAFRWYTPTTPPPTTWAGWLRGQVLRADLHFDLLGQIAMHCLALFAVFMICHGELAKRKPAPRYLTAFFLMISIGGALGSGFVSLVAPMVFAAIWEWWFGLTISVVLLCLLLFQIAPDRSPTTFRQSFVWFVLPVLLTLGATVFQSSQLPLDLADRLEPIAELKSQLPDETAEDFSETTEADFGDEEIEVDLADGGRLSSAVSIVGLVLCIILAGLGGFAWWSPSSTSRWIAWLVVNATALGLVCLYLRDTLTFAIPTIFEKPSVTVDLTNDDNVVWRGRNFYGALSIDEVDDYRTLQHGRIVHGLQYLDGPRRSQPTTYYSSNSGVSIALDYVDDRATVHLGAIGLGTGTLAAFVAPDWKGPIPSDSPSRPDRYHLTVYEINPLVVELSEGDEPWFCYMNDAKARGAKVDVVLGDARLMMERQPPQAFDVLAVDAFSGDSIPTHLLTDEAMTIYDRHLHSDGILAVHISNRYLDLEPICKALALRHGYQARVIEDDSEANGYSSTWVLLTRNQEFLANLDDFVDNSRALTAKQSILWTDAFSSLYAALMNSNYDSAVETIIATSWFQRQLSESPKTEIAYQPRWLRAEWLYCETIPDPASPARGGYNVRVFDGMVEIQPRGSSDATWVAVE